MKEHSNKTLIAVFISIILTAIFLAPSILAFEGYVFTQVDSFSANCHQGIYVNNSYIWTFDSGASGTNGHIYKYDKSTHSVVYNIDTSSHALWANAGTVRNGLVYQLSGRNSSGDPTQGSLVCAWYDSNQSYYHTWALDENTSEGMDWWNNSWYMVFSRKAQITQYDENFNFIQTYPVLDCVEGSSKPGYQDIAFWEEGTNGTFCGLTRHGSHGNHLFIYHYNTTTYGFDFVEEVENNYFNQGICCDVPYNVSYVWVADRTGGDVARNLSCNAVWDEIEDEAVDFTSITSINNKYNNSATQDQCRWLNWTRNESATKYSIRISNTPAMDDIFLQLDNITVSNGWCNNTFLNTSASASPHAYNYWENSTHCFFYLPYAYNITDYGYDYYQVRAYTT